MTPQEQQLLQDFLTHLVEVQGIAKDPAADALIAQALAKQPDAAYLLVQRSLLVGNALTEAQAQIARLEAQVQVARPAQSAGGFLDASSWGRRGAQTGSSPTAAATSLTGMPLGPARGMTPAAAMAATPQPAARSGFLGNMAATAAGVVGGAFLFQGLSHMMNSDSASQSAQNQPATLDSTPLPPTSTAATGTGHDGYDGGSSSYDTASYDTSNDAGSGDESSGDA